MKRLLITVALAAIFLFVVLAASRVPQSSVPVAPTQVQAARTVQLKGQLIRVSVVDTEDTRRQGLSGRAGLDPDEGMLFIFPEDGIHGFWMKDMRFSIDIFWLSSDGTIVYMAQNVSPDTYPQNFGSGTPTRYVLELSAGYAETHGVDIGDVVRL